MIKVIGDLMGEPATHHAEDCAEGMMLLATNNILYSRVEYKTGFLWQKVGGAFQSHIQIKGILVSARNATITFHTHQEDEDES